MSLRIVAAGLFAVSLLQPCSAAEFVGLGAPFDTLRSEVSAVSGDGTTVVGSGNRGERERPVGFRWVAGAGYDLQFWSYPVLDTSFDGQTVLSGFSSDTGWTAATWRAGDRPDDFRRIEPLDGAYSMYGTAISADGSIVIGYANFPPYQDSSARAFRWSADTGVEWLGSLQADEHWVAAWGVSGDGRVAVGFSSTNEPYNQRAFRWSAEEGMQPLGDLPGMSESVAAAASFDGQVIVGTASEAEQSEAFRWTAATGMVGLGGLPNEPVFSVAGAVSDDGRIILGEAASTSSPFAYEPFLWTADQGMRRLQQVLIDDYSLGGRLAGWTLYSADDISADGRVIVGTGRNPQGGYESWRAVLVPEPPAWQLAAGLAIWLLAHRHCGANWPPCAMPE
jgi:probable HAF family extracellular repeat protein